MFMWWRTHSTCSSLWVQITMPRDKWKDKLKTTHLPSLLCSGWSVRTTNMSHGETLRIHRCAFLNLKFHKLLYSGAGRFLPGMNSDEKINIHKHMHANWYWHIHIYSTSIWISNDGNNAAQWRLIIKHLSWRFNISIMRRKIVKITLVWSSLWHLSLENCGGESNFALSTMNCKQRTPVHWTLSELWRVTSDG